MRPPQEVLTIFSNLSEFNGNTRKGAIKSFLDQSEQLKDTELKKYCVERLIGGLASSRAASRIGFSTAFTLLIQNGIIDDWSVKDLLQMANKRIDLSDPVNGNGNGLGHYILLVTIINSKKYKNEDVTLIVTHAKKVRDAYSALAFAISNIISVLASNLEDASTSKIALEYFESHWQSMGHEYTPESVASALQLRKKFTKHVAKHVEFVNSSGLCKFSENVLGQLLIALKKTDPAVSIYFVEILLNAADESSAFDQVYSKVIEPWAFASGEAKSLERIFSVTRRYFEHGGNILNVDSILSTKLLERMESATRGKGQFRVLRSTVNAFGVELKEKLKGVDGDVAFQLLEALSKKKNVDVATGVNLTASLYSEMKYKHIKTWIKDTKTSPEQVSKASAAFTHWDEKSKILVLTSLLEVSPKSQANHNLIAKLVESLFYIKTRAGDFASLQLSEDNEKILKSVTASVIDKKLLAKADTAFEKSSLPSRALSVFWHIISLWAHTSPASDDAEAYSQNAEELLTIATSGEKGSGAVLIDLLISILSHEQKYHRTPVSFTFAHCLPSLKYKDIMHIIETAMLDDDQLMDDEDEEEVEEGEDEHGDVTIENEEEVESDDEDGEEEVDEELVKKLNEALGDAAVNEGQEDFTEENWDDEKMARMDERLAAAFKELAPSLSKKRNAQNVEVLKMKLTDLLLITISSKDAKDKLKIKLVIPLLQWAKKDVKAYSKISTKVFGLLKLIVQSKLSVEDTLLATTIQEVLTESQGVTNPVLIETIATIVTGLLRSSANSSGAEEGELGEATKAQFVSLFNQFLQQTDGAVPNEFVIVPLLKYPKLFTGLLEILVEASFNETYRIFRRTEILNAAASICTKQVLKEEKLKKSFVSLAAKAIGSYLTTSVGAFADVKTRFFANVVKFLISLSSVLAGDEKKSAILKTEVESAILALTDKEFSSKLKKINHVSQQVNRRSIGAALNLVAKNLEITLEK